VVVKQTSPSLKDSDTMAICNQRTVIITGAGGGLGRAYALAFAAEGANVVVNDIRLDAAQAVVAEVAAAGGHALANSGDITTMVGAQSIIDAALVAYGEVDVLVNNAGILRDRMFVSLSEDDWDQVMRVHLKGHFCLANLLGKRWRDAAKAGKKVDARIINTSSGAGLQGSIGQSNYSAAKGGIATLTLVQAAEMGRYGVTANALAPAARTAMTEAGMPDMVKAPDDGSFDAWAAENVAPLVVWLGSTQSAHVTGKMFESQGGRISMADGWRTDATVDKKARWQPSELGPVIDHLLGQAVPAQRVWGS
jgi:NAD(P)-dependent dehydrogenase (short-subunit alcohol dehydrogenase family)